MQSFRRGEENSSAAHIDSFARTSFRARFTVE
jgi:hypothetical protein